MGCDMKHNDHNSNGDIEVRRPPSKSPAAQLRRIGLILLMAGFAIAGMIYVFVPEDASSEENASLTEYYDKQAVAVQRMWGREGSLTLQITRSLKRPSTYAVIVIVLSTLGSFACFYLARDAYDASDEQSVKPFPQPSETLQKPASADPTKHDPDL